MKTLTIDIPTSIKTSISLNEDLLSDLENYSKNHDSSKGQVILKIISDGLKKSDRKLNDLVEDSGFARELKAEVLKALNEFLGTYNLSEYVREELKKRLKRDEKSNSI